MFCIWVKLSNVNLRKAMAIKTVDYRSHATFNSFIWQIFRRVWKIERIFVMPVCPNGTTELSMYEFLWNFIFEYFSKICQENSRYIKIEQEWRVIYMNTITHFFIISLSVLLRVRNVSDKTCGENQNTNFMSSIMSSKIVPFMRLMWKNIVQPGRQQMTI